MSSRNTRSTSRRGRGGGGTHQQQEEPAALVEFDDDGGGAPAASSSDALDLSSTRVQGQLFESRVELQRQLDSNATEIDCFRSGCTALLAMVPPTGARRASRALADDRKHKEGKNGEEHKR